MRDSSRRSAGTATRSKRRAWALTDLAFKSLVPRIEPLMYQAMAPSTFTYRARRMEKPAVRRSDVSPAHEYRRKWPAARSREPKSRACAGTISSTWPPEGFRIACMLVTAVRSCSMCSSTFELTIVSNLPCARSVTATGSVMSATTVSKRARPTRPTTTSRASRDSSRAVTLARVTRNWVRLPLPAPTSRTFGPTNSSTWLKIHAWYLDAWISACVIVSRPDGGHWPSSDTGLGSSSA